VKMVFAPNEPKLRTLRKTGARIIERAASASAYVRGGDKSRSPTPSAMEETR